MNTIQIDRKLDKVEGFLGAFPYNQMPKPKKKQFSLIINTSSSDEPGTHWLALVYKDNVYYFVDSYGRDITNITFSNKFRFAIKRFIGKKQYRYNKKLIQQLTSNTCGDYAIYFIHTLNNNISLQDSLKLFSSNLEYNDVCIKYLVKNLL